MKKAYIDLTEFDVQRGNLRKAVDRAIAQTDNQYSPVVFLARPSHVSEVESALVNRANSSVIPVTGMAEVLTHIQAARKRAEGLVPNAATDYVFTFSPEVRNAVVGWKAAGWNVYARWASDLLAFSAPTTPSSVDAQSASVGRSRNRKYEVAKHKAKKLRVYAEWRARRAIYDAMEAAANAKEKVTLADLKRDVMRRAREGAAGKGFDLQPNHFFAANDSVFRVALSVGVFRTDGRSIGDQDVSYVVQVTGIDPDFRDRCDLFILESVINELGDVTDEHCLSLAHLMYGEGAGEADGGASLDVLEEKFGNLMKLFGARLGRNQAGFYRVTPEGGEKVQSITANSR
jgi:hypothetical protein